MRGESPVPRISVILPTYNEAENVKVLIPRLKEVLEGLVGGSYEVIVVDDDSPDGTAEVAAKTAGSLGIGDRVRVIVRRGQRGLATAVLEGFRASRGEFLVVMDADLQHPPEKVAEIYRQLVNGADIVVASRFVRGGGDPGLTPLRRLASRAAALMGKLLVPQIRVLSDPMSGFFGLRKSVIEGEVDHMKPRGYKILLEVMVRGRYSRERVAEIPFVFMRRAYGKSKLGLKEVFDYALHLLSLNNYRILKFMLVGTSGVLVNEGVLWLLHYWLGVPVAFASPVAIELSILNNFTLNSLITFRGERVAGGMLVRLAKYHLSTAIGALVNYVTLLSLVHLFGVEPLAANLVGIVLGFLANYTLSEHYVWKRV